MKNNTALEYRMSKKMFNSILSGRREEEKIKWHTQRGESMINYTEFGDLVSIMGQNFELFEVHIISLDWAR